MNTYETMKHNIPEGATHYIDGDFYFFAWVNLSEGKYYNEGEWLNYEFSTLPDGVVKPIPVEAPKEEAKTYRYEKVTDSIFDLKAEFECGELYFAWVGNSVGYDKITDEKMLLCRYEEKRILRRIEVTERELFIEEVCKRCGWQPRSMAAKGAGKMFDSGCRFVNGKG